MDSNAAVEVVGAGFAFTEGPVWNARDSSLLFSDLRSNAIFRWAGDGPAQPFRSPSGEANGNTFDLDGRLLSCEHANRRVSRTLAGGSVETLVSHYEGKRLNSPNDLVVAANGDVYFTDPPYGLRQPDGTFGPQEVPFNGVYCWSARDASLHLLSDAFVRPNGIVLSGDQRTLYVADTQEAQVMAIDLGADGSAGSPRLFARTEHDTELARPDGMKMDALGHLYVTSSLPSGIWVYGTSGDLLGKIGVGEGPANCAFGGAGWRTLFVTARTSVYSVELNVAGQPVG